MPPKPKFSKDQIVDAAFDIAREEGLAGISIRKVAGRLGCSIAPIYGNFDDVEGLLRAVVGKVVEISRRLVTEHSTGNPFFDIGAASVRFARTYPALFRDLVLTPNPYLPQYEAEVDREMVGLMKQDPDLEGLPDPALSDLLLKMRVFHVGLSAMAANGLLPGELTEVQVIDMLEDAANDFVAAARAKQENGS